VLIQLGTNPNVPDAPPVFPSEDESDYVTLRLQLGAAGKLPLTAGCARCHEVSVRAGAHLRTSPRVTWEVIDNKVEHLIRFLRGTNYPVQVLDNPYAQVLPSHLTNATPQQYTATYSARFLTTTNTPYPFLTDPNQVLGTNRPMVLEQLGRTATLFVPDMTIATDADGDGAVNFTNRIDRTSAERPFSFWINDDNDVGNDDAAADEEVTSQSLTDSTSTSIDSLRDLEDFARLQFRIDGVPGNFVTNANLQTRIYLTNLMGTPQLRLFRSVETSGGIGYLTNNTTGNAQVAREPFGVLNSGASLTLSSTNWQAQTTNRFFLPLIFEGMSTGRCVVVFGLASNTGPLLVTSRPFHLNLQPVTSLYEHWTVGDNTTNEWSQIPTRATRTADSAVFGALATTIGRDYILFVHGWRMKPWERRAFASTGFKRLWQLGYRGRYGLFSWPTDWTARLSGIFWDWIGNPPSDAGNYSVSENRSYNSGAGLRRLLINLNANYAGRMRLFAHSMGNIVASEALRQEGDSSRPDLLLHTFAACQAASVAHAYSGAGPEVYSWDLSPDTPESYRNYPSSGKPYFTNIWKTASAILNYHNWQDIALKGWEKGQGLKPNFWMGYECRYGLQFVYLDEPLYFPSERYRIYSFAAEARSRALGAVEQGGFSLTSRPITARKNLNQNATDLPTGFGFGTADADHSAEFNSTIQRRHFFWRMLKQDFGL
jgi:hypothetical protein